MIMLLLFILSTLSLGALLRGVFVSDDKVMHLLPQLGFCFFWGVLGQVVLLQICQWLPFMNNQFVFWLLLFPLLIFTVMKVSTLIRAEHNNSSNNKTIFSGQDIASRANDRPWSLTHISLVLVIVLLLTVLYSVATTLPFFGWDGWAAWLVKSKVWYSQGLNATFTHVSGWYNQDASYSNLSAYYPEAYPLLHYATALYVGWDEQLFKVLGWIALLFFTFCMYQIVLDSSENRTTSLLCCLIYMSVPMVRYHVYSAGYVDLWLSFYLCLSLYAVQQFIHRPGKLQFFNLCIMLAAMIMFKTEGAIWVLLILLAFLLVSLNMKNRLIVIAAIVLPTLIWYFIGGIAFHTAIGEIIISPQVFQIADYFRYEFGFNNSTQPMIEALFLSRNWFIIWYILPIVMLLAFKFRARSEVFLLSIFMLLSVVFILFLFYLTGASKWAENFTSINRIVLHMLPVYIVLGGILIHQQLMQEEKPTDIS